MVPETLFFRHREALLALGRFAAERPTPAHALSIEERERILAVANEPRFADMPPARIVPMLADEGVYLASESSFGRVLRAHGRPGIEDAPRHRAKAAHPPRTWPRGRANCGAGT